MNPASKKTLDFTIPSGQITVPVKGTTTLNADSISNAGSSSSSSQSSGSTVAARLGGIIPSIFKEDPKIFYSDGNSFLKIKVSDIRKSIDNNKDIIDKERAFKEMVFKLDIKNENRKILADTLGANIFDVCVKKGFKSLTSLTKEPIQLTKNDIEKNLDNLGECIKDCESFLNTINLMPKENQQEALNVILQNQNVKNLIILLYGSDNSNIQQTLTTMEFNGLKFGFTNSDFTKS